MCSDEFIFMVAANFYVWNRLTNDMNVFETI